MQGDLIISYSHCGTHITAICRKSGDTTIITRREVRGLGYEQLKEYVRSLPQQVWVRRAV